MAELSMKDRIRRSLKQSDLLVVFARTGRELTESWRNKAREQRRESQQAAFLRQRAEIIPMYLSGTGFRGLQIGSGEYPLPGWLNTDLEPMTPDVIYLDALERMPFPDQVFNCVYTEHMIEHIPYKAGLFMLSECFRVLEPGGRIRVATPNVEAITRLLEAQKTAEQRAYLRWSAVENLGLYQPEKSALQHRRQEWDIDSSHFVRFFPDSSDDSACFVVNNFFRSYGHQFLYDAKTLRAALTAAGFVDLTAHTPGQSSLPELCDIESHSLRIGIQNNLFETMILEGMRPAH